MSKSFQPATVGRVSLCALAAASFLFTTACGSGDPEGSPQQPPTTIVTKTITTPNASGQLQSFSTSPAGIDTQNPFFRDLGVNGRTCNTCHVVDQGWSFSAVQAQARFDTTNGMDPLFRAVDGTNCPTNDMSTLSARGAATTLIRARGVIRIARPVPAGAEFSVAAVDDPHNCSVGGLSLYRRPLPSTNVKFLSSVMWDGRESTPGQDLVQNLRTQARNATLGHAEASGSPTDAQLQAIADFQLNLFTAQISDVAAGSLTGQRGMGGPDFLSAQQFFIGINDSIGANPTGAPFDPFAFTIFQPWENLLVNDQFRAAREAIARGQALFNTRNMIIANVNGLNDVSGQTVITGPCSICHDSPNLGHRSINLLMDIGTSDAGRRTPDMPLYTLACPGGINRLTMDPGLAMTTGLCADIGKFKVPILRGLAGRAPYFHDGQAATLDDVVEFYRLRFGLNVTAQERADLIAFLNSL
ncbi:MAG: hypothetical protein L0Z53_10410 [Acidobacteriales bacterium]|nr:hypothetical protein [Terriglobales bacterium]